MLNSLLPEYRMELLVQYKPLYSEMMMIYMIIFIVFWLISINYDIICFIVKSTTLTSREIDDAFFDFLQHYNVSENNTFSEIHENLRRQVNRKIVRLTVTEETAVEDALAYYKHPDFDARCPIRITFEKQPAVDTGGPRRQFYSMVFSALEDSQQYKLFEGPPGRLIPVYSASQVFSGLMKILGKMLAHSIVQCGVGMPVFSPVLYWYIITGDVSRSLSYANPEDIRDEGALSVIDKVCH